MKRLFAIAPCITLLILLALSQASARVSASLDPPLAGAMKTLKLSPGEPDLLVLTNAAAVRQDGKDCLSLLDRVQEVTGARVGRGSLLFFQRPQDHALRIMLFKKSDRKAVVISAVESGWAEDRLDLSPAVVTDPEFWKSAKEKFTAGRDMFTLATLANAWAEGVPYDFLKSAEFHNHICPGLTSGYLMARFILNHYPLGPGQRYTFISSPVWCKEDALQVVLDLTAGKRGIVTKPLSGEQKNKISVKNPAGFLLIWNQKTKTGKGVALSFDFGELASLYPEKTPKGAAILYTASHLSNPDRFVSVSKEFRLDESLYNAMREAGHNPYEAAGLTVQ